MATLTAALLPATREGVERAVAVVSYGIGGALLGIVTGLVLGGLLAVKLLPRVMLGTVVLAAVSIGLLLLLLLFAK